MIDKMLIKEQLDSLNDAHKHTTKLLETSNTITEVKRLMLNQNIIMNSISILLLNALEK